MEEQKERFRERSEDLSEILGSPPGWLVRWGTTVVLVAFGLILLAGWMIRYPDVISARVVFTTETPPVEIVARSEGHLAQLLVKEKQQVAAGEVLAVLQSAANYRHVLLLDQLVSVWENAGSAEGVLSAAAPDSALALGEIRPAYTAMLQQIENYRFNTGSGGAANSAQIDAVNRQINQLQSGIRLDQSSRNKSETQVKSARERLEKRRALLKEGLISGDDFDKERDALLDLERRTDAYTDQILRKQSEIAALQRSAGMVRFDEQLDASSAAGRLRAALGDLRAAIDQWKLRYLLITPIEGRVSLNNFFAAGQYVKQGEQVMTVAPPADTKIIGRSMLPIAGSGKVEEYQKVVIRLDNYPYYEFGSLRGVVLSKASVPKDNQYAVTIGLDSLSGATTNFGHTIEFQQQLQGEADIVTADKRFLQRVVDQLFAKARG